MSGVRRKKSPVGFTSNSFPMTRQGTVRISPVKGQKKNKVVKEINQRQARAPKSSEICTSPQRTNRPGKVSLLDSDEEVESTEKILNLYFGGVLFDKKHYVTLAATVRTTRRTMKNASVSIILL